MIVALAVKCLCGLAKGLRKKFAPYAGQVSLKDVFINCSLLYSYNYTLSPLENDRDVIAYSGGRRLCVFSRVQKGTPGLTQRMRLAACILGHAQAQHLILLYVLNVAT